MSLKSLPSSKKLYFPDARRLFCSPNTRGRMQKVSVERSIPAISQSFEKKYTWNYNMWSVWTNIRGGMVGDFRQNIQLRSVSFFSVPLWNSEEWIIYFEFEIYPAFYERLLLRGWLKGLTVDTSKVPIEVTPTCIGQSRKYDSLLDMTFLDVSSNFPIPLLHNAVFWECKSLSLEEIYQKVVHRKIYLCNDWIAQWIG